MIQHDTDGSPGCADAAPFGNRRRALFILLLIILSLNVAFRSWYAVTARNQADEDFSFENALGLVSSRQLKPVNGYYALLSYLPHAVAMAGAEHLYLKTGHPAFHTLGKATITEEGRRLSRLIQMAIGTLVLVMLYVLARRVFDERVAFWAVVATCFSAFNIWAWGYFKPDALMAFFVLLALYASVRASESPAPLGYAGAGVSIALAMSAKLPGGVVALPLTVATLMLDQSLRKKLGFLALSGGVAVVTYLLLNPYWKMNIFWLGVLSREYAWRSGDRGRIGGLKDLLLEFLPHYHGWIFAACFWTGLVWLTINATRRATEPRRRMAYAIILSYPIFFTIFYFSKTTYFKGNNFTSVAPLVSLIASFSIVTIWDKLHPRVPGLAAGPVSWTLGVLLAAGLIIPGFLHTYRKLVPMTTDVAYAFVLHRAEVSSGEPAARRVYLEDEPGRDETQWQYPRWSPLMALTTVHRLDGIGEDLLDRADGEIFFEARKQEKFYSRRIASHPELVQRIRARPFGQRGPGLVAIAHPWVLAEPVFHLGTVKVNPGSKGVLAHLPEEIAPRETVSLLVWIGFKLLEKSGDRYTEVDGRRYRLWTIARRGKGFFFATDRFTLTESAAAIKIVTDEGIVPRAAIDVYHWMTPTAE